MKKSTFLSQFLVFAIIFGSLSVPPAHGLNIGSIGSIPIDTIAEPVIPDLPTGEVQAEPTLAEEEEEEAVIDFDKLRKMSGKVSVGGDDEEEEEVVIDLDKLKKLGGRTILGDDDEVEVAEEGETMEELSTPEEVVVEDQKISDELVKIIAEANSDSVELLPGNEVKLTYKQPAKLFGLIPMNLSVSIIVSPEGEAEVKLPWYRIFFSDSLAETKLRVDEIVRILVDGDSTQTGLERQQKIIQTLDDIRFAA